MRPEPNPWRAITPKSALAACALFLLACSERQTVRLGDGLGSGGTLGAAAGSGGQSGAPSAEGGAAGNNEGASGAAGSDEGAAGASGSEPEERPFGPPVSLGDPIDDAPSPGKYDDPSLTRDRLQLFFNVDFPKEKDASEDIWVMTRESVEAPFGRARPVTELNTSGRETGIAVAPDGLTIWFSSDRDGDTLDVYMSTRNSLDAPWSAPVRVESLSTDQDDLVSGISDDELTLTLARRAPKNGQYDIYLSTRPSKTRDFPEAEPVTALNTAGKDGDAALADGKLTLIFTRGPDGGHGDLYLARRSSLNEPFSAEAVTALEELNTECDERDPWLSEDGRYLVFSSNRDASGQCHEDIYFLFEASR